jgi:dihydrofolate reductase
MRTVALVAALTGTRGIGFKGGIPWKLPKDMEYFARLTRSTRHPLKRNAVIMGRITWESLPAKFRPLPDRLNVVLTSRKEVLYVCPSVVVCSSLTEALSQVESMDDIETLYIIGGERVFAEAIAMKECTRLYLTHITSLGDPLVCDRHFPDYEHLGRFQKTSESQRFVDAASNLEFTFAEYASDLNVNST